MKTLSKLPKTKQSQNSYRTVISCWTNYHKVITNHAFVSGDVIDTLIYQQIMSVTGCSGCHVLRSAVPYVFLKNFSSYVLTLMCHKICNIRFQKKNCFFFWKLDYTWTERNIYEFFPNKIW
jgi:hypothetical protein